MSAPTTDPAPNEVLNGPMQIRTLYSGDRIIIDALVVDSSWRTYPADDTLTILDVASEQQVQVQVRAADGTEITTPAGPMELEFYSNITVGEVHQVAYDQPARVWSVGAPPNLVFNFEIPEGERGVQGQIGLSPVITAGAVNTVPFGSGARANLYGPPSGMVLELDVPAGPQGDPGVAATKPIFKLGTITTGAAGSSAGVTLVLDSTDPTQNTYIMNFTIPQGLKGDTGNVTSAAAGGDLTGNYPNPVLSAATKALFDAAGAATTAVTNHKNATDPHGDRAYTDSKVGTNTSAVTLLKQTVFGDATRTKKPYNAFYNTQDYSYAVGAGDVWAMGSWAKYSSCTDPSLVVVGSPGTAYSYFVTPVSGRYWLHYHCEVMVGATAGFVSASVTSPDRNIGSSVIAHDQKWAGAYGVTVLDAQDEYYLTAGTKVYWSNWGSVAHTLRYNYNGLGCRIVMSFMGLD